MITQLDDVDGTTFCGEHIIDTLVGTIYIFQDTVWDHNGSGCCQGNLSWCYDNVAKGALHDATMMLLGEPFMMLQ